MNLQYEKSGHETPTKEYCVYEDLTHFSVLYLCKVKTFWFFGNVSQGN